MTPPPRFGRMGEGPAPTPGEESFLTLAEGGGARVERIASRAMRQGEWQAQGWDEFVLVVAGRARLGFADGSARLMGAGDWAVLPAGYRHRVEWTEPGRETLWLAVHLPPGLPSGGDLG